MGVMSCEETRDVFCMAVTPACSKGALGTWRSLRRPSDTEPRSADLRSGDEVVGKPAWAGCMYVSA